MTPLHPYLKIVLWFHVGITLKLPSPLQAIDPDPSPFSTPITIRRLASEIEGVDKIMTEEIISEGHSQMVAKGYASQVRIPPIA